MVMLTVGLAVAVTGSFLVVPAHRMFGKNAILTATFLVWVLSAAVVILAPSALWCFAAIFAFYFAFGIAYPTLLSIFSMSVGDEEQGWIMGITIAVFTAVGGIMSLVGGGLISINLDLPFYLVIATALIAVAVQAVLWQTPAMVALTGRTVKQTR